MEDDGQVAKIETNWNEDRYQSVIVQRNLMIFISLIALVAVVASVIVVFEVTSSKTIEPFVIEIEKKTGVANLVQPLDVKYFSSQESLNRHFLVKYIEARESYNYYNVNYNYSKIVRLFSDPQIYREFRNWSEGQGFLEFRDRATRNVRILSFIDKGNYSEGDKIMINTAVRFETDEAGTKTPGKKIWFSDITFFYESNLQYDNLDDRYINPLGFTVKDYKVTSEAQ